MPIGTFWNTARDCLVSFQRRPLTLYCWASRLRTCLTNCAVLKRAWIKWLMVSYPLCGSPDTCRERPDGQSGYLTLAVVPYAPGLLLIVSDTTQEGELMQRLMQQRNEVMLLQERLQQVNQRLDYLIRHFVPDGVAQQLMAQPELPQPGGQRRVVSVLFADIRGYTALAEVLAPEDLMTMLNQQYSMIGGLIVEYGGVISHYVGDMIMAVFNALGDQADHAVRAVHAALDIQSELSSLDKRKSQEDSSIITQFGIGINTGPRHRGLPGL